MNALVLDASAAVEILAETSRGDALLSEAATRRNWWVPDHFHPSDARIANAPNLPVEIIYIG